MRRLAWLPLVLVGGCQAILGIEDTSQSGNADSGANGGSGGTIDSGTGATGGSATGATGGSATGATGGLAGFGGDAGCPSPFTLDPISSVAVVPGGSAQVTVSVTKAPCFDGRIVVTLPNLPSGATSSPGTIISGASSTDVTIDTTDATAFGSTSVTVSAVGGAHNPSTTFTLVVKGASGTHDSSLDQDGVRVLGPVANGKIKRIAPLPNGDIILAMDNGWSFVKLDAAGATVAFTPAVSQTGPAGGVVVDSADIVIATDNNAVRLHADGSADQSFSQDGLAMPTNGELTNCDALDVAVGGGSVVTGGNRVGNLGFVGRFLANGTYGGGTFTTRPTVALAVQPSGRILSGVSTGGGDSDFQVSAFDSSLSPDATFGSNGTQTVSVKDIDTLVDMVVLPSSSKLALIGSADPGSGNAAGAVAMLTQDGAIDTSYNSPEGSLTTQVIGPGMHFVAGGVQADDKVVAIGNGGSSASGYRAAVIRFDTAGKVDTTFNAGDGSLTLGSPPNATYFTALAVAPDGKLLIGGYDNGGVFLMRLWQ